MRNEDREWLLFRRMAGYGPDLKTPQKPSPRLLLERSKIGRRQAAFDP
ncbi:hypothetical protein GCM10007858_11550 [Bradyrhizobium liaoningense]|nr:hypothetical protein GCM10007858_11550 [Bradyrhizobium liaoningense]